MADGDGLERDCYGDLVDDGYELDSAVPDNVPWTHFQAGRGRGRRGRYRRARRGQAAARAQRPVFGISRAGGAGGEAQAVAAGGVDQVAFQTTHVVDGGARRTARAATEPGRPSRRSGHVADGVGERKHYGCITQDAALKLLRGSEIGCMTKEDAIKFPEKHAESLAPLAPAPALEKHAENNLAPLAPAPALNPAGPEEKHADIDGPAEYHQAPAAADEKKTENKEPAETKANEAPVLQEKETASASQKPPENAEPLSELPDTGIDAGNDAEPAPALSEQPDTDAQATPVRAASAALTQVHTPPSPPTPNDEKRLKEDEGPWGM